MSKHEAKVAKAEADSAKFVAARTEMIAAFREGVRLAIRHALEGTSPPADDAAPPPGPEPVRYVQAKMF